MFRDYIKLEYIADEWMKKCRGTQSSKRKEVLSFQLLISKPFFRYGSLQNVFFPLGTNKRAL